MKLFLSTIVLVFSLGAFAADGWLCVGETAADTAKIKNLKLGDKFFLSSIEVLTVNGKYCNKPHVGIYAGMCEFKGNTLAVGLGPVSEITTKKGQKINVFCEIEREIGTSGVVGGSN